MAVKTPQNLTERMHHPELEGVVGLQGLNVLRQEWSVYREKRKKHSRNYGPWLNFPECQALAGCDLKSRVSEISFLRPRVNVKASFTSSLLVFQKRETVRSKLVWALGVCGDRTPGFQDTPPP